MVVNLLGAEQNAYFYVAWMIAVLLFSIPGAVSQSLFVEGSHFDTDLEVNIRRSFRFIFLLLIPATVLLFLLGKWLLLAFGAGFPANALTLLWILVLSSIPLAVNSVYRTILRVTDRMRELMVLSGFTALAVLVGSYFLTAATGILGVGYAWLAAQGLISVYVVFAMRSRRHTRQA
jgi:O-antigen/teichoic acid export membrane protein